MNMVNHAKEMITQLLSSAGVTVNGKSPGDIIIHNEQLYSRVLRGGSLALGESYMDGWWDCDAVDVFISKVLRTNTEKGVRIQWRFVLFYLSNLVFNRQSRRRASIVGEKHYDVGNDLYQAMLDKRLVYTCGYWKHAKNLDEAQEAKFDLVCKKLNLKPGMKILDIGCGWGSFAKFAAEKYKVNVVGVTISKEQAQFARKLCEGLPVEIRLIDYRAIDEKFDHIVSLGMFEHVGVKNYRTYMKVAERCLKDNGLFLLHTIGYYRSARGGDPWLDKYIFPNGMLPSIAQIGKAIEKLFIIEDLHNFGAYYDLTLMAWSNNFNRAWPELKSRYSGRFYRMWNYYLLSCAGAFRAREMQLWQIVLSKKGVIGGYDSIR
ncbi:MAG TPA: cyclopropane fatty acyl phospholipid synthase [Candidatus Paceibacterota bacterium]|nr:cyclopropane fatty acyl phospholipid synthase [Candidatus Paceibacterota bacterium]